MWALWGEISGVRGLWLSHYTTTDIQTVPLLSCTINSVLQYYHTVVVVVDYSCTVCIVVIMYVCYYDTTIQYSLESTDDNTVPGHGIPAKQAISPAVVAPRS